MQIPTPVFVAVLIGVVLVLGFALWRGSNTGANTDDTEARLQKAFGGVGGAPKIPPPPPDAVPPSGATSPALPNR
jgi:hypothetical protein